MAHLQPYASRCDGRHAEGVGPEGTPQGLSQKSSGAEEAPAETRGHNQAIPCLHRQTAQESKSQCGDTLTGLAHELAKPPYGAVCPFASTAGIGIGNETALENGLKHIAQGMVHDA